MAYRHGYGGADSAAGIAVNNASQVVPGQVVHVDLQLSDRPHHAAPGLVESAPTQAKRCSQALSTAITQLFWPRISVAWGVDLAAINTCNHMDSWPGCTTITLQSEYCLRLISAQLDFVSRPTL